jgi:hypothetical protein
VAEKQIQRTFTAGQRALEGEDRWPAALAEKEKEMKPET